MKTLFNLCLLSLCICLGLMVTGISVAAQTDTVLGKWISIDHKTKQQKSVVEIYQKDGMVYGKIIEILREVSVPNPPCTECTDDRKDQPILGMDIIREMTPKGDGKTMANGTICDPEDGNVYKCTMWRDGEVLKVRGWIGFLYETQTWLPIE